MISEPPAGSRSGAAASSASMLPCTSVRRILETMQQVSGPQYAPLLRAAGGSWARFADALPPDTSAPSGVTEADLSHLYGTLHRMMGEALTRAFLQTYGRAMGTRMTGSPGYQEMRAAVEAAPPGEKLGAAVRAMAAECTARWTPLRGWEDAEAVYLEFEHCPVCAEMRGAREPMCAGSEAIYTQMVRALTGVRVTFHEVECAALGAPRCCFRAKK